HRMEVQKQQQEEEVKALQISQRGDALVDAVRQYEHVLVAFEEEVMFRRGSFSAASYMLGEIDRFSNALLRRSEANLQELTRLQIMATENKESELRTAHESAVARLMQIVYASQEQSEAMCRRLLQQLECEARAVCEAHIRRQEQGWQKSEMHRRIESLIETLQRDKARHVEEKKRLEEELCVLRCSVQEQQQQRELAEKDAQQRVDDVRCELRRVECELIEAERRHTLECAALRTSLEEECAVHTGTTTTKATMTEREESIGEHHKCYTADFEVLLKQMEQFVGVLFSLACDTVYAKISDLPMGLLLLETGVELKPGEAVSETFSIPPPFSRELEKQQQQQQQQERDEMHERIRSLMDMLQRERTKHEEEKNYLEKELRMLRHCVQDQQEEQESHHNLHHHHHHHQEQQQNKKKKQKHNQQQQQKDSHDFRRDESHADIQRSQGVDFRTPPRRSVSTGDVTQSMVRFSKMLNEQRCKNDTRLQNLDTLMAEVDDLIERGRIVTRLERSSSLKRESSNAMR
ncbi:uncharacterized protein TM35_000441310, partial [Trypanosoma theileri]